MTRDEAIALLAEFAKGEIAEAYDTWAEPTDSPSTLPRRVTFATLEEAVKVVSSS